MSRFPGTVHPGEQEGGGGRGAGLPPGQDGQTCEHRGRTGGTGGTGATGATGGTSGTGGTGGTGGIGATGADRDKTCETSAGIINRLCRSNHIFFKSKTGYKPARKN